MILAEYRSALDNILATAVDSSTWPDALLDEALRLALDDINGLIAYETDFVVSSTSYTQELSTIADINQILALAYPWVDGGDFAKLLVAWRRSGLHTVHISEVQPANGQKLRVRYTKLHKIDDLDAAAATTAPAQVERLLLYAAASWCCVLRRRQISENPALPEGPYGAGPQLAELAELFRRRFEQLVLQLPPLGNARFAQEGI